MAETSTSTYNDEPKPFKEDELAHYAVESISDALKDKQEFDKLVIRWYKDYRDIKDPKLTPWKGAANWSVPISSTAADGIIPRINDGIYDFDKPVDVKAMSRAAIPFRDTMAAFVKWDIETHQEIKREMWFFNQNSVWSGTGLLKSFMEMEKTVEEEEIDAYVSEGEILRDESGIAVPVSPEMDQQIQAMGREVEVQTVVEKRKKWKKYAPNLTVLDLKDLVISSDATSFEDAWENGIIGVRVRKTKDKLRRKLKHDKKGLYKNLDKIKISGYETKLDHVETDEERRKLKAYASKTKKVEFWELYCHYDIDSDGLDERIVVLVEMKSKTILGYEKYPYDHGKCPIIPGYIKPIHGQPFGVGIIEMLYDTKGELDSIHNQRTDRHSIANNPPMVSTAESGLNLKIHKFGRGRHWRLKNIGEDAIKFMLPPKLDRDSKDEEDRILGYAQKRTGVNDYTLGSESNVASNKTATGILTLVKESNIGFKNFIRWQSLAAEDYFNQRYALYQQYWGNAADAEVNAWIQEIMDVPENPLAGQGIEAIRQSFNIVMTASKEDKQTELTRAQVMHDVLKESPIMQEFPLKMRDAEVELLRKVGVQDPEKILPTDEEIKQWQVEIEKEAQLQIQQDQEKAAQEQAKQEQEQAKAQANAQAGSSKVEQEGLKVQQQQLKNEGETLKNQGTALNAVQKAEGNRGKER